MSEVSKKEIRIVIVNTPLEGAYELDGEGINTITLDPGDDVRLRFDGETLLFEDFDGGE